MVVSDEAALVLIWVEDSVVPIWEVVVPIWEAMVPIWEVVVPTWARAPLEWVVDRIRLDPRR